MTRVLAVGSVAACSAGDGPADADPTSEGGPWSLPVELELGAEGGRMLSSPISVERGGLGFALLVEGEGCAQVARLETGPPEQVWVSTLERGASCADCQERFSVIAGSGLVVHAPREPSDSDATIRFGAIDCESLTPLPAAEPRSLRVWSRALPPVDDVEPLPLVFRHGPASPWSTEGDAARLAARIGALLAGAGLEVDLLASTREPWLDAPVAWFEGIPVGLPPLAEGAGSVQVVFRGCLERVHPLLGTRVLLDGFVPRVPAHGTPGAAVYVRHRGCSRASDPPVVRSAEREARLVAHEIGHFLGLYHPEDPDGQRDRLPDTEDDTLMAAKPAAAEPPFFSELQAAHLRLHAALLAEGLPRSPR